MVQQDHHQLLTSDHVHRQLKGLIPGGMLALWLHRRPPLLTWPQPKPGTTQSDDSHTGLEVYDSNDGNNSFCSKTLVTTTLMRQTSVMIQCP